MVDNTHVYYATLKIEDCRAEIFVNGVPVLRLVPGPYTLLSVPVNHYLCDGDNRFELLVEPGARPRDTRYPTEEKALPDVYAHARLARFGDGDTVNLETGEELADIEFEGSADRKDIVPLSLTRNVDMGTFAGRWAFQDAAVLTLNDELVQEAHMKLEEIAYTIRHGSLTQYLDMFRVIVRERHRAYPALPQGHLQERSEDFLQRFRQKPDQVLPPARDQHEFRLVADGRMIECVDRDFFPSLRMRSVEGNLVPMDIFLGRIDGRLEIVR